MENPTEFSEEAVVKAVMDSGVLGASKHQILLFKYLLKSKYNNDLEGMKAYKIAIDAFGRSTDFDSSSDSIVRVEMFRLRANLRSFNQDSSEFHLELPKASYDIKIKPLRETSVTPYGAHVTQKWYENPNLGKIRTLITATIAVGVGAFLMGNKINGWIDRPDCSNLRPNVAIVSAADASDLELYVGEVIHGAASQYSHFNIVKDIKSCRSTGTPGYELQYTIFQDDSSFRGTLKATSDTDNELVISQNFSGKLKNNQSGTNLLNDEFYNSIVRSSNDWLRPYGIIHRHTTTAPWKDSAKLEDYSCLSSMYESYVSDSDKSYSDALVCLEKSYNDKTPLLDNLGGLAASYVEQAQGIRAHNVADPLEAALNIMDEVGERWPESVETTIAKIMIEVEREDYNSQSLGNVIFRAEKIYGSNPLILAEIAKYSGFKLGNWEYAKTNAARANELISERDNSSYLVDSAYALIYDNSEQAMGICAKAYSENSTIANLLVNACAVKNKNSLWEQRTEENLTRLNLKTISEKSNFIEELEFDDTFRLAIMAAWRINL